MKKLAANKDFKFERTYPKISGYTTCFNALSERYPYIESIKSLLGFCDEVVVVDGASSDGTWESLEELAKENDKLKLYQNEFDWTMPGIDGAQKSFARALCENEFLWQMDLDELVHENDYEKVKLIAKRFPKNLDILHLPVIELWGDAKHVTGRRHAWKWRMSRNKPEITHAINKHARLVDEKTGNVYAKEGMSDGCEYVNVMTNEMMPHAGFWNQNLEALRVYETEAFGEAMNEIVNILPATWHTSWMDIPRKIQQLKPGGTWDKMWALLYQKDAMNRFPEVDFSDKSQVEGLIARLTAQGGEDSDRTKYTFALRQNPPKLLLEFLEKADSEKVNIR